MRIKLFDAWEYPAKDDRVDTVIDIINSFIDEGYYAGCAEMLHLYPDRNAGTVLRRSEDKKRYLDACWQVYKRLDAMGVIVTWKKTGKKYSILTTEGNSNDINQAFKSHLLFFTIYLDGDILPWLNGKDFGSTI